METEMNHGDCGSGPPSMNGLLDSIHAACSIEISDVDIYNEGSNSMENTFMQSIDEMAIEEKSPEVHSSQGHIKKVRNNADGDKETTVHWTCKSLLQLVKTVEKYPELWDNQYIYSIYSRNARWETVADILNTTVDEFKTNPVNAQEVTSKWRRLRGQKTTIEKKKTRLRRKRRTRIPNEFSYYNHMDFIFNPPSKQALKDGVTFPTEKLTQHDSKVKWNYQSNMALISEVKKHPVIWASNKGHPPSSARTKAYCAVLDWLNSAVPAFIGNPITMNDLRWKWKNLRGYRNRCRRNLKQGNSNGTEWEFFHAMDFLYPNNNLQQENSTTDSSLVKVSINQAEEEADSNTSIMKSQKVAVDSSAESIGTYNDLVKFCNNANMSNMESQNIADDISADISGIDEDHEANEHVFSSKRKWNYDTITTILNEIKKFPVIWDLCKNSHLAEEKFSAYDTIVTYLNSSVPAFIENPITVKDLSEKWKNLRCYKMRCLRSLRTNPNLREWEFFAALDFLEGNSETVPTKQDATCSSKSTVKWNCIKTMALINEVKKYPELWKEKLHHNASYNYEVYTANKKVVAHLNASIPDFKKNPITIRDLNYKWKNLRCYKMRCLRSLRTNPNLREWEFFTALDFLEEKFSEPATTKHDATCEFVGNLESKVDFKRMDEELCRGKQMDDGSNYMNMKSKVRWNYIKTMALINEVKKYPEIWNEKSSNNYEGYAANKKVVAHLNAYIPDFRKNPITMEDMTVKWKYLRQYARRCMRTKSSSGKEWEFYNALVFLKSEDCSQQQEEYLKSEVKWNHYSTVALIAEVKKYPELWNVSPRSLHHSSKYNMYKAQKNIVANLNATVPSFRKDPITISGMRYKWRRLRRYMTRCLNSEFTTGKKWEFYNALYFLVPLLSQGNSLEGSTCNGSNDKDDNNPYEPAIGVKCESTDYQMEESSEKHLEIRSECLTSSSSLINQRHWTEEAVDSHCAIPSYMMESNSPPPIASTGYENVSSSTDNSSDLCTIALLQIKYAFSMKQPSTDKQIRFYQSLSQICAKFIGGSERFSNDGDTGNQ